MSLLDKHLTIDVARVTEATAIAIASTRGRGDERAADQTAVDTSHKALNVLDINGTIVVGEGDRQGAEKLFIGENVGKGSGPAVDVAVDPLEGSTLVAKSVPNALTVLAIAEGGSLLQVPSFYMDKIAIGGDLPDNIVDLDQTPQENLANLAEAKKLPVSALTVCILDRPRHASLIQAVRETGAAINLISDGDIAGVIHAANPDSTGIDIYMGSGGAPEGVLAAAALRCIGGQMQGRLIMRNGGDRALATTLGIDNPDRKLELEDMASGQVMFAATGVTDGSLLKGVRLGARHVTTETMVMRSESGSVRWIRNRRKVRA